MMKYRIKTIRPKETNWVEIEAETLADACNDVHFDHRGPFVSCMMEDDGSRYMAHFSVVEVEGEGRFVSRTFSHGIFRKGGVGGKSIRDVEKILGLDPGELSDEGGKWEGEESLEEVEARCG